MVKSNYIELIEQYKVDSKSAEKLWNEINRNYTQENRYYHNLHHIQDLLLELVRVKDKIENWPVILFTLFYHDIIYKSTKKDNEEKSSKLATQRMMEIGVDKNDIELCQRQIIATKSHKKQEDSDTNYFTDADLSILGKEPKLYETYCSNIRKEYSIYPNFLYKKGRKKVVIHLLSMYKIFKTKEFYEKYEEQAKFNLNNELKTL